MKPTVTLNEMVRLRNFFNSIDPSEWIINMLTNIGEQITRHCAMGHMYINKRSHLYGTVEIGEGEGDLKWPPNEYNQCLVARIMVFTEKILKRPDSGLVSVNDNSVDNPYKALLHPKDRVLALCDDIITKLREIEAQEAVDNLMVETLEEIAAEQHEYALV